MIKLAIKNTLSLFFPKLCLSCGQPLSDDHAYICLSCETQLPETEHWHKKENTFSQRFIYDKRIESAAALYYFAKNSGVQHLIHKIKYKDQRESALQLGRLLGDKINQSDFFKNIDFILPVPMHPRKKRERGFNQAEVLAQGISEKTGWRIDTGILRKVKYTNVQAQSNYSERLQNVFAAYQCVNATGCKNKRILIVDDVATTGATLQTCCDAILEKEPQCQLFVVTLAFTALN